MNIFFALFFCSLLVLVQAQNASSSSSGLETPDCALRCFQSAIQNSNCDVNDSLCVCTDPELNGEINLCLASTCTVKEVLTATNISATECGAPSRDRGKAFNTLSIICAVLSTIAVLLRVLQRVWKTITFGLDDLFIIGILVANLALNFMNVYGLSANGFGRDVWTVPFDNITNMTRYSYMVQVIYFGLIPLIKIAILLFYLRIFVGSTIRRLIYMTIAFNVVSGMAYVFINVFQCNPISFYWTEWDGEHAGTCIDVVAIVNSYSIISIIVDVWMLVLPVTQIYHLNLHWIRKICISIMFGVGIFFTAVSIIRLVTLVQLNYAQTHNPTWDYFYSGVWSQVELTAGIIVACLPSIRILFAACFTRLGGSQQDSQKMLNSDPLSNPRIAKSWNDKIATSLASPREFAYPQTYKDGPPQIDDSFMYDFRASSAASSRTGSVSSDVSSSDYMLKSFPPHNSLA